MAHITSYTELLSGLCSAWWPGRSSAGIADTVYMKSDHTVEGLSAHRTEIRTDSVDTPKANETSCSEIDNQN